MSGSTVCRFYLKGCCHYGSSCRFLHSDNDDQQNDYDDYQPRNRRNESQEYYDDYSYDNRRHYDDYSRYEKNNHYSKQNYDNTSHYNRRGQNHRENYNNYHAKKNNYQSQEEYFDGNSQNYRKERANGNHYNKRNNQNTYGEYNDQTNYEHSNSNRRNKNQNMYGEYNEQTNYEHSNSNRRNKDEKMYGAYNEKANYENSNSNRRNKYENMYGENNEETNYENSNSNRYNGSEDQHFVNKYAYEQNNANQRETLLKKYEKEIVIFRKHVNEYTNSSVWPLSCFHPIGNKFPIQPFGCLNFTEASIEEIRCDFYTLKRICADPRPVHGQSWQNVMIEARKKKDEVLAFGSNVQDDLFATFEKCERSRDDPNFQNNLETTEQNSFWDMSIKRLNQEQMNSFSFTMGNKQPNSEKPSKNEQPLKIFMQTEVYGKGENNMYAQKDFTDFIPLMPPPQHYCL